MGTKPSETLVVVLIVVVAMTGVAGGSVHGASAEAPVGENCSFPVEDTDATGTTVTLEEPPERIVTTAPSAAQTLYEIGAWDRVVGVTQFANYLDGFEEREVVSAQDRVGTNVEKVIELDPDLVVAPDVTPEEDVQQMREAGLTVFVFEEADTVDGVKEQTLQFGDLVGECEGAEETVQWMEEELRTVNEAVESEEPVEALYVYSYDFGPFTAGENTFINDAIETAGAVNLAAEEGIEGHQAISDEVVAQQDPEWLIVNTLEPDPPQNDVYNATTAVQEDNVVVVDANYINQPAPRIVLAIRGMVQAFHPEAYAQAEATPTPTPTAGETPTGTSTATASPTPEDEGSPGFGPVAAVVGILAAALLALRRT